MSSDSVDAITTRSTLPLCRGKGALPSVRRSSTICSVFGISLLHVHPLGDGERGEEGNQHISNEDERTL